MFKRSELFFREITSPVVASVMINVGYVRLIVDEIVRSSSGIQSQGLFRVLDSFLINIDRSSLCRVPTQTYFDGINGTGIVAFSSDAKYLASLSEQSPQVSCIHLASWTMDIVVLERFYRFGIGHPKVIGRCVH